MASDGSPGGGLTASLVSGSQPSLVVTTAAAGGKSVPTGGKNVAVAGSGPASTAVSAAAASGTPRATDPQSLVDLLNKYLNDSGRPDQFRIDPASENTLIQEINPATGAVIGEFSVTEFPALARSVGATGLLVDSHA